jgi:hypothetical protein
LPHGLPPPGNGANNLTAFGQQAAISFLRQFPNVVVVSGETVAKRMERLLISCDRLFAIRFVHDDRKDGA